MIANYHTHTARCMHAFGTDEEYVEKAVAEELKILGFSDHAPFTYRDGYVSSYKMTLDGANEYFSSINSLREKYSDKIEIKIGYEAEYYPELWSDTLEAWKKCPPEYLILGQHFIDFECQNGVKGDHSYRQFGHPDRERVTKYVNRVIEGLATERFSCLAHPDMVSFSGDADFFLSEMERLIEATRKYGVPFEFNLLGFSEGRTYPREDFWRLAGSLGCSAVIGCDAHEPRRVADKKELSNARAILASCGVKILDTIELRDPLK